ncbi:MAG: hypothetical protein ABS68_11880 [Niastella sp. SCN 39-18]|nr:MAG: hypothetical protein ABS68_11880 [Niastella sp. SCN 39-18]OJW09689.1 MAG: hypothetical protein BGO53_07485 [Sphingobacteriales bacterium 39-19]
MPKANTDGSFTFIVKKTKKKIKNIWRYEFCIYFHRTNIQLSEKSLTSSLRLLRFISSNWPNKTNCPKPSKTRSL